MRRRNNWRAATLSAIAGGRRSNACLQAFGAAGIRPGIYAGFIAANRQPSSRPPSASPPKAARRTGDDERSAVAEPQPGINAGPVYRLRRKKGHKCPCMVAVPRVMNRARGLCLTTSVVL